MIRTKLRYALFALALSALVPAAPMAADAPNAPAAAGGAAGATDSDASPPASESVERSVVKIAATMRYPNPFRPWSKQDPNQVTASGVVIEGQRILTNAHAVLYASDIQVQASGEGDMVSASVAAVAPGIDLAVLTLDDSSFFAKHPPLERSSTLPQIKDPVLAYGFPVGGNSLSITKGIVSRIEFAAYSTDTSGLRIQIDAAINPGNSGGPAIVGDKMIGLAFSRLAGNTQNIGYIIPNEEIELFLRDIAHGRYDGKPAMYDELQTLENAALRKYLNVDRSVTGVVVHRPYRTDASYPLKEWDVISQIAGTPIDDEGMITLGSDVRLSFRYLIQKVAKNGHIPLTVVRAGKTLKVDLPVEATRPLLIPELKGDYPPYFIYGPLCFSTATNGFIAGFAENANVVNAFAFLDSPLITERGDQPRPDRQELVVISSPFFPNKLAEGYGNHAAAVLYSVNGTPVRSLAHLVALLRDLKDEFVVFELDGRGGEALVFPRKETLAATDEILTDNGVRAQGSPDMLTVWQGKGAP